jgi:DNA-binding MarR family transcriptional regulator/N-acetylglutamate synthase-like GNAT family acetyltransferase
MIMSAIPAQLRTRAERIRRFNRFYTKHIGVLHEGLLHSPFSLTEMRVLYELAQRAEWATSELTATLDLDAGYLSRILQKFESGKLIRRKPSPDDARQNLVALTAKGCRVFKPLNERSTSEVAAAIGKLAPADQERLIGAMQTIERLFTPDKSAAFWLRTHRAGDLGWVIARHGELYTQEYGWNEEFETLVAEIGARFLRNYDPARERFWIAERDGVNLGCVFLVKETDEVARLRLLLVEPAARGMGIGRRLVAECEGFARQAGYRKIVLWTQSNLFAARKLYADGGYRLVEAKPNHAFGADLVSETWELDLTAQPLPWK